MSRCRACPFRVHPSGLASAYAGELSLIKPDLLGMSPYRGAHLVVKEPASERFDPRNSTSVVGRGLSLQRSRPTGTLCNQPLVFRACSGVVRGTPPLSRPVRHPAEKGAGGRDALRRQLLCYRLCSEGHSSVGSAIGT